MTWIVVAGIGLWLIAAAVFGPHITRGWDE